jgi:hypothetical protein
MGATVGVVKWATVVGQRDWAECPPVLVQGNWVSTALGAAWSRSEVSGPILAGACGGRCSEAKLRLFGSKISAGARMAATLLNEWADSRWSGHAAERDDR